MHVKLHYLLVKQGLERKPHGENLFQHLLWSQGHLRVEY